MSDSTVAPGGHGAAAPPFIGTPPPVVSPPPLPRQGRPDRPIVPWVSIWTRPRATLRQILDTDPRRSIFRLAALGGIAEGLTAAAAPGFGDTYSAPVVLLAAVAGGTLGGLLALFVFTSLVRLAGRWMGGRGGTVQVMAALAWAQVPAVWGLLLWLPRAALLGGETFHPSPSSVEGNPPAGLFLGLLQIGQAFIGLWGLIVTLKCVGEAHGFSAWRALGALLLALLIVMVPVGLLTLAAQALG